MSFTWIVRLIKEFGNLFLKGTVTTLEITLAGTVIGYIIGFLVGAVKSTPIEKKIIPLRLLQ